MTTAQTATAAPVTQGTSQDEMALQEKLAQVQLGDAPAQSQSSSVAASLREAPIEAGVRKLPIVDPIPSTIPTHTPELTAEQQAKYDSLLETVKTWTEIPSAHGKGGPITDNERLWLTRECLLRYLRATKWTTADSAKRLLATLTWKREYGVEEHTAEYLSVENETGKQFFLGFDNEARPCHYLNPGRQNTDASPRQVQHLVFMLERVIEVMVPGQETICLLINFKSSSSRTNTAPGIGQGREVLNYLQTHYPERLGRALIINVPWIVNGFFKLITPFIDPLTRQKLKFNDDMRQHVPPEQLWDQFHGDLNFDYDHSVYWPAFIKLCAERRAEQHERWIKGGKHIGESEFYLKGGNGPSISQSLSKKTEETPVENGNGAVVGVAGSEAPVQTNGKQANGNTDIAAQVPEPILTTEGDRS